MAHYRLTINRRELDLQIDRALGKSTYVKQEAYKVMRGVFNKAYRKMMREFEGHAVTQELDMGPNGFNVSNTLDGYGNLFSFIGFDVSTKPTQPLRELLANGTYFEQTIYKDRKWYFNVYTPTQDEISSATSMPWEGGNSWAYGVERGISGLSHYMFKTWAKGRSGRGFQLPYENLEDSPFITTPYITKILANFRESINNK